MDLEELKEKVENVSKTLTIYLSDIKRFTKRLVDEFGTEEDDMEERVEAIDETITSLQKKYRKLKREIEKELEKIDG